MSPFQIHRAILPSLLCMLAVGCFGGAVAMRAYDGPVVTPTPQPAVVPTKVSQPMPFRLDDGRRAPREATLSGKMHGVSFERAKASAPRVMHVQPAHLVRPGYVSVRNDREHEWLWQASHAEQQVAAQGQAPQHVGFFRRAARFARHPFRPWKRCG